MANVTTLSDLRTQALDLADMTGSSYPVTARVTDYINHALSELHDILVKANEDYFRSLSTITLVAGTETYAVPTDYYKTLKMFSSSGGNRYRLKRFALDELDTYQNEYTVAPANNAHLTYRVIGQLVWFSPKPTAAGTVEHWYVPQLTKLSADGDTVNAVLPNGWELYCVYHAVSELAGREESDTSGWLAKKEQQRQRIVTAATERDQGEPHRIVDVTGRFARRVWR